jgi:hypothetical protein
MNLAEFVINPVTPQPTSSDGHMLKFVVFVSGKHFISPEEHYGRATYIFPGDKEAIYCPQ